MQSYVCALRLRLAGRNLCVVLALLTLFFAACTKTDPQAALDAAAELQV